MAARDHLGGLAPATRAAVVVLRAAYPWTLVETVGVGQSEVDVATLADSVVLVLQPGSGDTLQFMKAGILEIPDVFVVHKWDLGEVAKRTRADLEAMLALGAGGQSGWTPPVLGVSAQSGEAVEALAAALARHRQHLEASGELATRRATSRRAWALELYRQRHGTLGLERLGGEAEAARRVDAAEGTALDAYAALEAAAGY
jgi:LAO/AO transport system kinase